MAETYIQRLIKLERRNERIRAMRKAGKPYKEIASRFGMSIARAHIIVTGKNGK